MPGKLDYRARLDIFARMLLMRRFEEAAISLCKQAAACTPYHSCVGRECIPSTALAAVGSDDLICTTQCAHLVAHGANLGRAFAELLAQAAEPHDVSDRAYLYDGSQSVLSDWSVVGKCSDLALGAARGIKHAKDERIVLAFFDDRMLAENGASQFLASAAAEGLSLVLVCERSGNAGTSSITGGQPIAASAYGAADLAKQHGLASAAMDAGHVSRVYAAVVEAVERARGGGPTLIDVIGESFPPHGACAPTELGARCDPSRRTSLYADWHLSYDPVLRAADELVAGGTFSRQDLLALDEQVQGQIAAATEAAIASLSACDFAGRKEADGRQDRCARPGSDNLNEKD